MKPYYVLNWARSGDEESSRRQDVSDLLTAKQGFEWRRDAGDHVTLELVSMEGSELIECWPEDLRELYEKNC